MNGSADRPDNSAEGRGPDAAGTVVGRSAVVTRLIEASFPVGEMVSSDGDLVRTERPAGYPADRPDLHADPDDLVVAVADGLRRLHSLSSAPAGLDDGSSDGPHGWSYLAERCRNAVADSGFDAALLPPPYDRYDGSQLLAMMTEGRPATEELVLCHGQPTLDQFLVDGGSFTGFRQLDNMIVADRHLDLAIIHQSVHHELGPEAVFRFYEAYGADPDIVRLDHYILLCHLLGRSGTEPAAEPAGEHGS